MAILYKQESVSGFEPFYIKYTYQPIYIATVDGKSVNLKTTQLFCLGV